MDTLYTFHNYHTKFGTMLNVLIQCISFYPLVKLLLYSSKICPFPQFIVCVFPKISLFAQKHLNSWWNIKKLTTAVNVYLPIGCLVNRHTLDYVDLSMDSEGSPNFIFRF